MKIIALAVVAVGLLATAAGAVDVTACGQVVAAGEEGVLNADLDCSASASGSQAVVLQHRATLLLNGHSIKSPPAGACVACTGVRCAVTGPGLLYSAAPNPGGGIAALKNVTVSNDVTIDHTSVGISAGDGRLTVSDTFLSDNGDGIIAKKIKAEMLFVRDSERVGIVAIKSIRGDHIEVRDSGWAGVQTSKFKITELIATTNGFASTDVGGGIFATRGGVLIDSAVSANELNGAPADVVTGRLPIVINTSCDTSVMLVDGTPAGSWEVCSAD